MILASLFVGVTFLATELNIIPAHDKTVVSQIAGAVQVPSLSSLTPTDLLASLGCETDGDGWPVLAAGLLAGVVEVQYFEGEVHGQGDGAERHLAMAPSRLQQFIVAIQQGFENAAQVGELPVLITSR